MNSYLTEAMLVSLTDFRVSQDIRLNGGRVLFTSHSLIFHWKLLALIHNQESLVQCLSKTARKQQILEKGSFVPEFKKKKYFELAINYQTE